MTGIQFPSQKILEFSRILVNPMGRARGGGKLGNQEADGGSADVTRSAWRRRFVLRRPTRSHVHSSNSLLAPQSSTFILPKRTCTEPSPFGPFRRHVRVHVRVLLDLVPHVQAPDSRGRSKAMSQVPRAAENSRSGRRWWRADTATAAACLPPPRSSRRRRRRRRRIATQRS